MRRMVAMIAATRSVWLGVALAGASVGVAVGAIGACRVGPRDLVEVGARSRRPAQVGVGEVGAEKVGVGEVCPTQVRAGQVGPVQVGVAEIRAGEVGMPE